MKELFSIRSREITYRVVIVVLGVVAIVIPLMSLHYARKVVEKSKEEIYVLLGDKAIVEAKSTNLFNTLEVLCRGQVEDINKLIFEQVPDDEEINRRLEKAEYWSDKATKNVIDMQQQNNFYINIINQGFYTILLTEKIDINYSLEPYEFQYEGILKFIRDRKEYKYKIETEGKLEPIQATENNNRGIYVRNFWIKSFTKM